jgi:hypothetical protein
MAGANATIWGLLRAKQVCCFQTLTTAVLGASHPHGQPVVLATATSTTIASMQMLQMPMDASVPLACCYAYYHPNSPCLCASAAYGFNLPLFPPPAECSVAASAAIAPPNTGQYTGIVTEGTTVTLPCNSGYVGAPQATCGSNGEYTLGSGACVPVIPMASLVGTATASTFLDPGRQASYVYDGDISTDWASLSRYNAATGAYGNTVSTTVSGQSVTGEWVQLQFVQPFLLQGFGLTPRQDTDPSFTTCRQPGQFVVAGSYDGTTWTSVYTWSTGWPGAGIATVGFFINPTPSIAYT